MNENNETSKGKCKSIEQKEVDNGYGYVTMWQFDPRRQQEQQLLPEVCEKCHWQ